MQFNLGQKNVCDVLYICFLHAEDKPGTYSTQWSMNRVLSILCKKDTIVNISLVLSWWNLCRHLNGKQTWFGAFYCVKATFAINRNILKLVLSCVAASHGNFNCGKMLTFTLCYNFHLLEFRLIRNRTLLNCISGFLS